MALAKTTRLNLAKQDFSDPAWHTVQNAGMDDADARLLQNSDGGVTDPNGTVTGNFVGQLYIDEESSPPRVWVCRTTDATDWDLINTTGIETSAAIGGDEILEDILTTHESRLDAIEIASPDRGHIFGLTMRPDTTTDPLTDIEIALGECATTFPPARLPQINVVLTKQLDAAPWVVGDNLGGRPAAVALAINTWYHVFIIYDPTLGLTDAGFDTDISAGALKAEATGYTLFRRIGSILTDGSSNILAFTQIGDQFIWQDPGSPALDYDADPGTSQVTVTLQTPLGVPVDALIHASVIAGRVLYVHPLTIVTDDPPSISAAPLASMGVSEQASQAQLNIRTNTSKEIAIRQNAAGAVRIATVGYYDRRGRDG